MSLSEFCWKPRFTVFPIKPWTLEKISGMFIVSRPIRCEMKPQKITDKPQQGSVTTWYSLFQALGSWGRAKTSEEKTSPLSFFSLALNFPPSPTTESREQARLDTKQRAGFFFYKKSSISFGSLWKAIFWPQTNTSHLISSVQKPIYQIDLKVSANCENLQRYRSASWVKVSQLQKNTDRKPPITAN